MSTPMRLILALLIAVTLFVVVQSRLERRVPPEPPADYVEVEGIVLSPAGAPLANAHVFARHGHMAATSGPDGRFSVWVPPDIEQSIIAWGAELMAVEKKSAFVVLRTQPTRWVRGVVLDKRGLPVKGARLGMPGWNRVTTGKNGWFEFDLAGIEIEVDGNFMQWDGTPFLRIALTGDAWTYEPTPPPASEPGPVRGRIRDARGEPVPGAAVWNANVESWRVPRHAVHTDGDGRYHLPEGGTRVMAYRPDIGRASGRPGEDLRLARVHEAVLRGRIPGVSAARVTVSAGEQFAVVYTDREGRFTAYGLDEGAFTVRVSRFGYTPTVVRDVPTGKPVEIELKRAPVLKGRIVGLDDKPVQYARIIRYPPGRGPGSTHTDGNGDFELPAQRQGRYRILFAEDERWEILDGAVAIPSKERVILRAKRKG